MQISVFASLNSGSHRPTVDAFVEELAQIRDQGFTRVWVPQYVDQPDALTVLAVALREVDSINLATGVVPIQVQHPMLLAQRALTLSQISHGRFTLGIGASHRVLTEGLWGIPWDNPVGRMSEYLDGLLPLLRGQTAHAHGQTVTTHGALSIAHAPRPEVYIGAMGTRMLQLAGQRADGTLTWMTGPTTLATHIGPTLRTAATTVGRPQNAVRVAAALPISVTDDITTARTHATQQFAMFGRLPSYRAMLNREGHRGPEDAALIGDETTVCQRLNQLRAAGIDELVAVTYDPTPQGRARTRTLLQHYHDH
jgi:5,10-methylenetetrahydromethanopterin reductase